MSVRSSPAALRNRGPIQAVLAEVLPESGLVLEIASGTGEHVMSFAAAFPRLRWQASDRDLEALALIEARRAGAPELSNVAPGLLLDVREWPWPVVEAEALVCINMIHIAPWEACEALMSGAARVLGPGAPLYLYGPMKFGGRDTAPSNAAFDAELRARDPAWGVRDAEEVQRAAEGVGLSCERVVAMPANNFSLVFRRGG